ncbi:MAG: hypothetical protein KatS3mg015_2310 [Fimbriimonadales bacterium]|nr:MAG: hypothetical protein KatS3mg015_2310 [Fimbriimonadales bacterium]
MSEIHRGKPNRLDVRLLSHGGKHDTVVHLVHLPDVLAVGVQQDALFDGDADNGRSESKALLDVLSPLRDGLLPVVR